MMEYGAEGIWICIHARQNGDSTWCKNFKCNINSKHHYDL